MLPELLSLHISQLSRTLAKSKTNCYADSRKQRYHEQLMELFNQIKQLKLKDISENQRTEIKRIIEFCFLSIEFLDNSTLVNIPYEMVYCMERALNEWDDSKRYIIVTSLQNNIFSYSFNPELALSETVYDTIFANFNLKFKNRLIQINLPRYLAFDYMANVILFHELGHFVDSKYKITERIAIIYELEEKESKHYEEFFADIFAAQYVGEASNYYLNYIAYNHGDSETHPSTKRRIEIVDEFLNSKFNSDILKRISTATEAITHKKLYINSDKPNDEDFKNLIPLNINNESQLFSIFNVGWNLWISETVEFSQDKVTPENKYQIINNLIEKSISNYMILEKWNKDVPDKKEFV